MERHNGWANKPTWTTYSWLTNDEWTYKYWREEARRMVVGAEELSAEEREEAVYSLAARMEETVAVHNLEGLFADLLSYSLHLVEWTEVAEAFIDEVWDE